MINNRTSIMKKIMDKELEEIKKRKMSEYLDNIKKEGKKMENPDIPLKVTDADIEDVVKKYNTVVIDCWAPWCGPCRMVGPVIEELAKEMQGNIVFGKLNVDENQKTSMKHQIMSIPTLLIFKNGNLVDKLIGAMPKEILKQKLETY